MIAEMPNMAAKITLATKDGRYLYMDNSMSQVSSVHLISSARGRIVPIRAEADDMETAELRLNEGRLEVSGVFERECFVCILA